MRLFPACGGGMVSVVPVFVAAAGGERPVR